MLNTPSAPTPYTPDMPATTLETALAPIRDGMRVYLHGGAATPTPLLEGLDTRARTLHGFRLRV